MIELRNVNKYFNKHKKRTYSYTHYPHRGIHLHLKQNNLTYHSTGKNITGKNFNQKKNTKREV